MKATHIRVDGEDFLVVLNEDRWIGSTRPYLEDTGHEVQHLAEVELTEGASFLTDDHLADLISARDD